VPTICISVLLKTNGKWQSHTIHYCSWVLELRTRAGRLLSFDPVINPGMDNTLVGYWFSIID
jgi:hypothetical protein